MNVDNVIYFDGFGVESFPKEIKNFLGNKNISTYIEYKQVIQQYVNTFVLDILISC